MRATVEQSAAARPERPAGLRRLDRSLRPRLRGFGQWWLRSLAAWLPVRARDLFGLSPQRLLLEPAGEGLRLSLWRGDGLRMLADIPVPPGGEGVGDPLARLLSPAMARVPRWLLLPASAVLRRRLSLPAAAGERLREVLGFEIDRQTPFTAADVRYDARLLAPRGDQIEVELVVVPRATLDAALAALGPLAPTLAGVDVADAGGAPLGVNLAGDGARRRGDDPARGRNLVLVLVALLALLAGMWQLLANREAAAEFFAGQVELGAERARAASLERRQLVDLVEGGAFLRAARAGRPAMVEVMDELARRLPDDTYLEKLSIEGDRILLIGLSREASGLVARLQGSPLWSEPTLAGALQPDPRTRMDRFTLTATLNVVAPPGGAEGGQAPAAATEATGAAGSL